MWVVLSGGRPDWVGKLYPKGTKAKEFLFQYARQFSCIELNAVHYQFPKEGQLEHWLDDVGDDFKFSPKVHQAISHWDRLRQESHDKTDVFLHMVDKMGKKAGMSFLQLPPNFAPKSFDDLTSYLSQWPKDVPLGLELRHPAWFQAGQLADETWHAMRENNIAAVITDTSGRRDVLHNRLSTPVAFIRFVGNGLHLTDYERIDAWVDRLVEWFDKGLQTLYFYMHQHHELHSPELCTYLIHKLNRALGTDIKPPQLYGGNQGDLF